MSEALEPIEMEIPLELPSPFLTGTNIQYAWDSTSLGWLKTCPRLYQYQMIEGYMGRGDSVHLRFGIEYHQALHDYDAERAIGISHNDALHDAVRALLERTYGWESDHKTKNRSTLVRTVIWYFEKFHPDPAETLILDTGKPAVELNFKFELDWGPKSAQEDEAICRAREQGNFGEVSHIGQPYLLCGHLDRVVTFAGETYVMDRKTTGSTPGSYYFDQFHPNNQMSLYTLASQVVFDAPIKGVIIDVAQILVGGSVFTRGFTYRTPDQTAEWIEDLKYWFNLAEGYAIEGYWPQNDTACDKFGGCKFRSICSKSPQVREKFLEGDFEKGQAWNPLIPRD